VLRATGTWRVLPFAEPPFGGVFLLFALFLTAVGLFLVALLFEEDLGFLSTITEIPVFKTQCTRCAG